MSRDFTILIYKKLLEELAVAGYRFQTFEKFAESPEARVVILRHDVDRLSENALRIAETENSFGISASYYFRAVEGVYVEQIIREIASLGHEVAYHYEDVTITKGDMEKAIHHFEEQLRCFRKIYPTKTICMHGSPMSRWDNRQLWEHYNYRDFGIIAEPYFDVNYDEVLYITDTGRRWNEDRVSVRDRVESGFDIQISSTDHLIELLKCDKLPDKMMINTHPHRWFDNKIGWLKEYIWQNIKNAVKYLIIRSNG